MVVVAVGISLVGGGWPAAASEGPRITVDHSEVAPGDPVIVSLYDFTGQAVTVAVCGNLAQRGSADCNMPASQSERIRRDQEVTLTQLFVQPPPVPCPCLIRASTATNDEFAVAPIVLVGHPEAPVVEAARGPLLDVAIEARRAPQGLVASLRSELGGPTRYVVTVSVRNLATQTLSDVVLDGGASHRLDDDAADLVFEGPGPIEPGQTWEQSIVAEVPAPVVGRFTWSVTASGAGPTVGAEQAVDPTPVALFVLAAVLVVDVVALAWRVGLRRRRRAAGAAGNSVGEELSPPDDPVRAEPPLVTLRT